MEKLIRRIDLRNVSPENLSELFRREWLVTNGLGGYASGTISGSVTWRYHGLLIAALQPSIHSRGHEQAVNHGPHDYYRLSAAGDRYEITRPDMLPTLRLVMRGESAAFTYDGGTRREIFYPKEADRGYQSRGLLWSPGHFSVTLHPHRDATLMGSTESWHTMLALTPQEALAFYHERHRRLLISSDNKARDEFGGDL